MSYELTDQDIAEIDNRFSYHAPKDNQFEKYMNIRQLANRFARAIYVNCPNSRERSTALTRLDEAVMHANAAIARNE